MNYFVYETWANELRVVSFTPVLQKIFNCDLIGHSLFDDLKDVTIRFGKKREFFISLELSGINLHRICYCLFNSENNYFDIESVTLFDSKGFVYSFSGSNDRILFKILFMLGLEVPNITNHEKIEWHLERSDLWRNYPEFIPDELL